MWPEIPNPWLQQQQGRRGLLSRARTPLQQVPQEQMAPGQYALGPMVQPYQQPPQGQTPIASVQPETLQTQGYQLPAMPQQVQAPQRSGFRQFGDFVSENRQPLMAFGAQLLDGQGYGAGVNAFQGQQDRSEAKALQQEELGYMRGERKEVGDERRRMRAEYERVLADPNVAPDVKAAVRAAGPGGMSEILGTQVMSAGDKARIEWEGQRARVSDEQWRSEYGQRERQIGATNRGLNLEFGMGRYTQAADAELLQQQVALSAQIQSVGLPSLLNVQQTIAEARKVGGVAGQPLGTNERVTLGRLFNGSGPGRPTLEVWRAQVLTPALESMRGLGAMTEKEFEAAMSSFANPNMTLEAAETLMSQKLAEARRRVATADVMQRFAMESNGITGRTNKAGQNFGTYLTEELDRMGLGGAVPPVSREEEQAAPKGPPPVRDLASFIDRALTGRLDGGLGNAQPRNAGSRIGATTTDSQGFRYEKIRAGPDTDRSTWRRVPNGR